MHNSLSRLTLIGLLASPLCLHAGERYAFLVGVQQYQNTDLRSLKYSEKDVEDLTRVLTEVGYKPANILVLTEKRGLDHVDARPDKATIDRRLDKLLEQLQTDDTLLVAFSGHGVQFAEDEESYFCPAGTVLARKDTLLPLYGLYKKLSERRNAGTTVILVDACRSAPQVNKSPTIKAESITRPPPSPGGIEVFFSCSKEQESFEHEDLEHGVFFHYVIQGLRGHADTLTTDQLQDREVTSPELQSYVVGKVKKYVAEKLGREQTPHCIVDRRGEAVLAKLESPPAQAPEIAIAPFKADKAGQHQQEWSKFIGTPIEQKNALGMEFMLIPPGRFVMGSELAAAVVAARARRPTGAFEIEHPRHEVEIVEPLYVSKYEVTRGQFRAFVTATGHTMGGGVHWDPKTKQLERSSVVNWENVGFDQTESHPVVLVSFNDATAFCKWLSEKDGQKYRLLTEEEWEYACRAGTNSLFCNANTISTLPYVANLADKNSGLPWSNEDLKDPFPRTAPVGSFDPNAFGLHDMHGNVYEWTSSVFARYKQPRPLNGKLITRGGSWESVPEMVRSALRLPQDPAWRCDATGFRIALVPQPRANARRAAGP